MNMPLEMSIMKRYFNIFSECRGLRVAYAHRAAPLTHFFQCCSYLHKVNHIIVGEDSGSIPLRTLERLSVDGAAQRTLQVSTK